MLKLISVCGFIYFFSNMWSFILSIFPLKLQWECAVFVLNIIFFSFFLENFLNQFLFEFWKFFHSLFSWLPFVKNHALTIMKKKENFKMLDFVQYFWTLLWRWKRNNFVEVWYMNVWINVKIKNWDILNVWKKKFWNGKNGKDYSTEVFLIKMIGKSGKTGVITSRIEYFINTSKYSTLFNLSQPTA